MNENLGINNSNERIEKITAVFMQEYNDLSSEQQVQLFGMIRESVLKHRNGMINDCKSDLEATDFRLKTLYAGLDTIQTVDGYNSIKGN